MMKNTQKLTNKTANFQCPHNNTGFCKFRDNCRYQHFYTVCLKNICRNRECKNRHPKTCKFEGACKFDKRNACAYKHVKLVDIKSTESTKVKALEDEIKDLQTEISNLKSNVQLKEEELKQIKDDLNETEGKNKEMKKVLTNKITILKTVNVEKKFDCNSCDFKALREMDLENHKQSKHDQLAIIKQLKTLLVNKDEKIEILNQKILEIDFDKNVQVEKQNEEIHNINHMKEKDLNCKETYQCPYCAKKFNSNFILKDHIINHSGRNLLNAKVLDSEESDWETSS